MTPSSPSGIQGAYAALCTLEIPNDWSAEQALAVWELLDALAERIWRRYELALMELIRAERLYGQHDHPEQFDLFDPDDPIPF